MGWEFYTDYKLNEILFNFIISLIQLIVGFYVLKWFISENIVSNSIFSIYMFSAICNGIHMNVRWKQLKLKMVFK